MIFCLRTAASNPRLPAAAILRIRPIFLKQENFRRLGALYLKGRVQCDSKGCLKVSKRTQSKSTLHLVRLRSKAVNNFPSRSVRPVLRSSRFSDPVPLEMAEIPTKGSLRLLFLLITGPFRFGCISLRNLHRRCLFAAVVVCIFFSYFFSISFFLAASSI